MDERELADWLDALAEQRLIEEWHWTLLVEPGQPAVVCYLIDEAIFARWSGQGEGLRNGLRPLAFLAYDFVKQALCRQAG